MITKPTIYISYAWGDKNETSVSREKIVDDLCKAFEDEDFQVMRDKVVLEYRESIFLPLLV